ncbi:MAG: aminoacyl-histidine dipeptidase [Clostridiales bacterium]|jgi:dipeptidase D|nr:aminoacyl-histidine dipeptidase [Clostridiales bacterium]
METKPLRIFREISKIPRGSGNEKGISDWCAEYARDRGFEAVQDSALNVIIKVPGTEGYENKPPVILQGHMDMVCEKNADKAHDFSKDPITLVERGDMIYADGTTLGADNGVAVAMCMALLDESAPHPPLEILLTVDEEQGMVGVIDLDPATLTGRRLINLDSEEEGYLCTSCAGGRRVTLKLSGKREKMQIARTCVIKVRGLRGGHSGAQIDQGLANSARVLARVLLSVVKEHGARVAHISGGLKNNAIPRESEAVVFMPPENYSAAEKTVKNFEKIIKAEYRVIDPGVTVSIEQIKSGGTPFDKVTSWKIPALILLSPDGVLGMSADIKGLVETSNNLGVVQTDGDAVSFSYALRSSVHSKKDELVTALKLIGHTLGAEYIESSDYPAWAYAPNSPLRDSLAASYEDIYGAKPQFTAIHAGLECGILGKKLNDCDMVSLGPNLYDVHSPDEHMSVSSLNRTYEFLLKALANLSD